MEGFTFLEKGIFVGEEVRRLEEPGAFVLARPVLDISRSSLFSPRCAADHIAGVFRTVEYALAQAGYDSMPSEGVEEMGFTAAESYLIAYPGVYRAIREDASAFEHLFGLWLEDEYGSPPRYPVTAITCAYALFPAVDLTLDRDPVAAVLRADELAARHPGLGRRFTIEILLHENAWPPPEEVEYGLQRRGPSAVCVSPAPKRPVDGAAERDALAFVRGVWGSSVWQSAIRDESNAYLDSLLLEVLREEKELEPSAAPATYRVN